MTTENDEQISEQGLSEEETQAQIEENEAAFEAGFNKSHGDEPSDETPAEDVVTVDDEPLQEEITQEQAETFFAGKTEAEITALLDKVPGLEARLSDDTRKLYGRFGDVQSRIQKIEAQASKSVHREIRDEDFEGLIEEFPELAEMLLSGLRKSLGNERPVTSEDTPKAATADAVDVQALIQQEVDKVRHEQEMKLLSFAHKDWKTLSQEAQFNTFLNSLPGDKTDVVIGSGESARVVQLPAEAAKYVESNDALTSAECFTKYKDWKSAQSKKSSQQRSRLESAVTPTHGRGAPAASTIDDETAFLRGVNKAKGTG